MFSHMIRHFLRSLLFDEQETRRSQEFGVILSSSWLLICSCDSPSCMYFYLHPVFVIKDSSAHRLIVVESDSRESVVVTLGKVTDIQSVNMSTYHRSLSSTVLPIIAQTLLKRCTRDSVFGECRPARAGQKERREEKQNREGVCKNQEFPCESNKHMVIIL